MNWTKLVVLAGILSTGSLFADSRSLEIVTGESVEKDNYEDVSYELPSSHKLRQELTVYQALAAAITQTVVLAETRQPRLVSAEEPRKKITLRGRDLTLSYSRNRYEQHCYLAVGPRQKWRTINGQWAAREVNGRAIKRALNVLLANGITVRDVSISVSRQDDVLLARRLLHQLGLGQNSVVGHDPATLNHATISFNNIK